MSSIPINFLDCVYFVFTILDVLIDLASTGVSPLNHILIRLNLFKKFETFPRLRAMLENHFRSVSSLAHLRTFNPGRGEVPPVVTGQ